ncbi:MAG: YraN family protein [Anaerolineales bacterium]|nr:YraN family protein [Anaerolineales bacterium]
MGIGQWGESLVAAYLENNGLRLVDCNWRCPYGELDVVGYDGDTLVVVEVRTRRGKAALERALASVDHKKQAKLASLVQYYCAAHQIKDTVPVRIDVVGVAALPDGLAHIEWVKDALVW